jgi:hypothetical protein
VTGRRSQGRRDYAVLITLLRPDLRAGEAAARSLEDLGWRAAENVVHGKGRRDERLPLPDDVGTRDRRLPAAGTARDEPAEGVPAALSIACEASCRAEGATDGCAELGQTWADLVGPAARADLTR